MSARKIIIICVAIFNTLLLSAQSLCEVTAPNIDVMSRPDTASLIVGHLSEHDIITVKNISKGWATISYNERTAYVSSNYIAPLDSNDSYYANLLANERIKVEKEKQLLEKNRTDSIQKAHKQQQLVKKRAADSIRKANRNPAFIGFNAGLGGSFGKVMQSFDFSIGAEMAFSYSKKKAIGYFISYDTFTKINLGLLFIYGDYVKSNAIFWGVGYQRYMPQERNNLYYKNIPYKRRYNGGGFVIRFGYKPQIGDNLLSRLYYTINLTIKNIDYEDVFEDKTYNESASAVGTSISVGYKFNTKKKNKN